MKSLIPASTLALALLLPSLPEQPLRRRVRGHRGRHGAHRPLPAPGAVQCLPNRCAQLPTLRQALATVFGATGNRAALVIGTTAEKQPEASINVFPSPNDGHFTVAGARPGSALTIVNPLGAIVLKATVVGAALAVDLSHLPAGVYFVRVQQPGLGSLTRQVVVSR